VLDQIGGPRTHNNYPWGWTMAGNSPFRRWKREVHQGGIADPCVISWPRGGIDGGGIRRQFTHAIDVLPTLIELIGLELPAELDGVRQTPLDGQSFGYLLPPGGQSAPERHDTQYFEMFSSRAIYRKGWKAVAFHPIGPLYDDQDPNAPFDEDVWELYHVERDLSETRDLAGQHPGLLAELIELVGRGPAEPGAATRQSGAVGHRESQAGPSTSAGEVPLLPRRGPGARDRRGEPA